MISKSLLPGTPKEEAEASQKLFDNFDRAMFNYLTGKKEPIMNTISITQVYNGFIINMHDERSNLIDTAIAIDTDKRGYGQTSLITVIEEMFARNRVPVVSKPVVNEPDASDESDDALPF